MSNKSEATWHPNRAPVTDLDLDLDLETITARADAASDGSWFVSGGDLVAGHVSHPEVIGPDWASGDDAEFIAHARADVPALVAELRKARAERDAAQKEVQWWENWENKVIEHLHQTWDDDIAQIALLTNFIEHAANLDSVMEDAREADGYEGNALTFVWDDDTRTLSPVSLARHDAEVKAQALEELAEVARSDAGPRHHIYPGDLDERAAAIRAEAE